MKRATTSASNIFRRKLCPGSARMEKDLREEDTEFSTEGQMLHALFLTGKRPDTLTQEQAQALDMADFYAEEFFGNLRQRFNIPMDARFVDERDIMLIVRGPDGEELFPGHADVIRTWPEYDVRGVVDAKFGFMEVEWAPDNLQLASYIVGRQQMSAARAVGACIVQPRNFGPRMSQAGYSAAMIPAAAVELRRIFLESEKPDAPLIAGEKQCHFCRAKAGCSAYIAKFEVLETVSPGAAIELLPGNQLERLHVAIQFANKIREEVSSEMRRRIAEGTMPGWKLQNSGDDVDVKDTLGFFNALRELIGPDKFTAKTFDDCREIQWGKLADAVQSILKVSEKRAKEIIKDVSAPYARRTPKAKKVVRDKQLIKTTLAVPQIDGQDGEPHQ